jgi:hypothetical protein
MLKPPAWQAVATLVKVPPGMYDSMFDATNVHDGQFCTDLYSMLAQHVSHSVRYRAKVERYKQSRAPVCCDF